MWMLRSRKLSEGFKLTFIKAKNELWRNEASYYSETIDATFPVQVVAYEDGSYAIEGVYGSNETIEFYDRHCGY